MTGGAFEPEADIRGGVVEIAEMLDLVSFRPFDMGEDDPGVVDQTFSYWSCIQAQAATESAWVPFCFARTPKGVHSPVLEVSGSDLSNWYSKALMARGPIMSETTPTLQCSWAGTFHSSPEKIRFCFLLKICYNLDMYFLWFT